MSKRLIPSLRCFFIISNLWCKSKQRVALWSDWKQCWWAPCLPSSSYDKPRPASPRRLSDTTLGRLICRTQAPPRRMDAIQGACRDVNSPFEDRTTPSMIHRSRSPADRLCPGSPCSGTSMKRKSSWFLSCGTKCLWTWRSAIDEASVLEGWSSSVQCTRGWEFCQIPFRKWENHRFSCSTARWCREASSFVPSLCRGFHCRTAFYDRSERHKDRDHRQHDTTYDKPSRESHRCWRRRCSNDQKRPELEWTRWRDDKGKLYGGMRQRWSACSTRGSCLWMIRISMLEAWALSGNLLMIPKPGFFSVSKSGRNFSLMSGILQAQSVWINLISWVFSLSSFLLLSNCCPSKNNFLMWFWYWIFFIVFMQFSGAETSKVFIDVFFKNSDLVSPRDGMNLSLLLYLKTFWK